MTTPTDGYNPNIPTSENNIAESQINFLNNFENLFNAFSVNHIPLNDTTSPGNHSVVELKEQLSGTTTQSQEIAIYSKKVANQTDQIFMRYGTNGKEFQITEWQIYPVNPNGTQQQWFTFLPGGIVVYFGFVIPNKDGFNIDINPSICSNIMGVNLCPIGTTSIGNPLFPSNFTFIIVNGKATNIVITNSTTFATVPPPQYYLAFGNI